DTLGRAGRNDVSGLKRHHEGHELDELIDWKEEMLGVRRLSSHLIDPSLNSARAAVEAGRDARTDRRDRVQRLGASELRLFLLQIARRDVIEAGQSENMIPRGSSRHSMGLLPDHDGELGLMIDAADAWGQPDGIAGAYHGRGRLEEDQRLPWQ